MAANYVQPVQGKQVHLDQGVDYQGKPGDSVVAIGTARVDYVKDDPHGFGKAIYYTLMDGPLKGQQIYVGHAQPVVAAGQFLAPGTAVATLLDRGLGNASGLSGWTEIGFAKDGVPDPAKTGAKFQIFVNQLKAPETQPQTQQAPTQQAPDFSQTGDTTGTMTDPTQTQPQALPPGTDSYALWQKVVAQPYVDQSTLSYAQNVATASGG